MFYANRWSFFEDSRLARKGGLSANQEDMYLNYNKYNEMKLRIAT